MFFEWMEELCINQEVGNVGKFIFFKEMICNSLQILYLKITC
jgi:hypothetical protein